MLKKLLELFRESPEAVDSGRDELRVAGTASLEFQNVSLSYKDGRCVLADISFKLEAGRTLGVVGASGAGKSTLVRLLTRLIEPTEGSILVDGIPTSELPLRDLRNAIAVVPQDTVLFNDTIGYNIAFGRPECSQSEIEHAAKLAQLHDFIMKLPDGYATKVGERGLKLSGGERQRIAIARAALKRPRIYVFDEATSSLDSRTEREILANIRAISQSCTTLIIAHRLSTVVHADEIVVLHNGRIVEQGSHPELLKAGGHYAALWCAQNPAAVTAS